jgi:hypothetical protein
VSKKTSSEELDELTELFRTLGAPEPEGWAASQLRTGVDQVARFVFLRLAWKAVVPPDDDAWIDLTISRSRADPSAPCSGAGPALERMLAAGAERRDIHELVRVMQYEALFSLCYLLGDPGGDLEPEIEDLMWRLYRADIDDDQKIHGVIGGLHESLLRTDPSGREMRPRR